MLIGELALANAKAVVLATTIIIGNMLVDEHGHKILNYFNSRSTMIGKWSLILLPSRANWRIVNLVSVKILSIRSVGAICE